MFLIVGLGNIGGKYHYHRHNIGFLVMDELWKNCPSQLPKKGKHTLYVRCPLSTFGRNLESEEAILSKPTTYMNSSGNSVLEMMQQFKIKPNEVVVICDDFDLPFAKIRIRPRGSAGTHNGLKSIEEAIGSNYVRVRCGIFQESSSPIEQFVLSPFEGEERLVLPSYTRFVRDAVLCILTEGIEKAMNRYNNQYLPSFIPSKN